jgi:hypothetical protein
MSEVPSILSQTRFVIYIQNSKLMLFNNLSLLVKKKVRS